MVYFFGFLSFVDYDFKPFGGESCGQVLGRQLSLLDYLYSENATDPILLIGHGTSLNTLLAYLKKPRLSRGEYREINYP